MTESSPSLIARLEALRNFLHDTLKASSEHPFSGHDGWRGSHAERLSLYRERCALLRGDASPEGFAALSLRAKLEPLDEDILLLALAPSLDRGFYRLFSGLRRSLSSSGLDIDLILSLLTCDLAGRLGALERFSPSGPLFSSGLLLLHHKPGRAEPMHQEVRVPFRVLRELLGETVLTRGDFALIRSEKRLGEDVLLDEEEAERLISLLGAWERVRVFREEQGSGAALLLIAGPSGTGKSVTAEAVSSHLGRPLLVLGAEKLAAHMANPGAVLEEAMMEARVSGAVLCLDECEFLLAHRIQGNRGLSRVLGLLDRWHDLVVLTTSAEKVLDPSVMRRVLLRVGTGFPSPQDRSLLWARSLPASLPRAEDLDLSFVAEKYEFTGAQIEAAASMAVASALSRGDEEPALCALDIEAAARSQLRHHLANLAVRTVTHLTLKDVVLPVDLKEVLRAIISAVRNRRRIFEDWGFGERLTTGHGLTMLFRGESGTGKTLSAEILASELAMPLYRIAIPRIVSKYIGETEQNLEKAFREAQTAGAILLFDEADAIFTKRVEVSSSTDRYSNMEVNLLLQEMERFEGVVILTTNLDAAIDDAFDRRLNYKLDFPFPEAEHREEILTRLLPSKAPVELEDGELEYLAERFELSGGSIKNVVVRAAYAAAEAGDSINIDHLENAAIQEYRELGKLIGSFS